MLLGTTIRLTPVKEYRQKSHKSTADKLRRLTTCVATACPEDCYFKAYAMTLLGHDILRFINKIGDQKKTAIRFDLAQDLSEGLQCKRQIKN